MTSPERQVPPPEVSSSKKSVCQTQLRRVGIETNAARRLRVSPPSGAVRAGQRATARSWRTRARRRGFRRCGAVRSRSLSDPTEVARNLAHLTTTGTQDRVSSRARRRQIPPRQRGLEDRRHPATLPKPPDADRARHAGLRGGVLAGQTTRDRRPEPLPMLASTHRWTPRRPHHQPPRPLRSLRVPTHRNSSRSSVATTT